jgi:hypothetical protein
MSKVKTVKAKRRKLHGKKFRTRRSSLPAFAARINSCSLVSPLVIEFGDPALREAYRLWWHPYDMGEDFDTLTGRDGTVIRVQRTKHGGRGFRKVPAKHPVMRGDQIERRRLDPGYYRRIDRALAMMRIKRGKGRRVGGSRLRDRPSSRPAPVKVIITLTYPLAKPQQKVVAIDRRYPGAIFGLAHDFYRELYAQDERDGGKAGPMGGGRGPLLNRGCGPLVWGHDLGDLVFESCEYRAFDPVPAKRLGAEGEFTFGIGS